MDTDNLDIYGNPRAIHTAFGVAGTEPYGATRWRFDRDS